LKSKYRRAAKLLLKKKYIILYSYLKSWLFKKFLNKYNNLYTLNFSKETLNELNMLELDVKKLFLARVCLFKSKFFSYLLSFKKFKNTKNILYSKKYNPLFQTIKDMALLQKRYLRKIKRKKYFSFRRLLRRYRQFFFLRRLRYKKTGTVNFPRTKTHRFGKRTLLFVKKPKKKTIHFVRTLKSIFKISLDNKNLTKFEKTKFPLLAIDIPLHLKVIKNHFFLNITIARNNVFFTLITFTGKTIYKCSGGYFGARGKKRRDFTSVTAAARHVGLQIQQYRDPKLFLNLKVAFNNKFIRSVIYGLSSCKMWVYGIIYNYNRAITRLKIKKLRRI